MTEGVLLSYLSGRFSGLPYHLTIVPTAVIGGYGNPRSCKTILSIDHDLSTALLTITVSGTELVKRRTPWRVVLGSVTLTREFRPQVIADLGSRRYASVVFDVSQIIRGKGKYEIKISSESSQSITVEAVSVTGIVPLEGAEVSMGYWAGVTGIKQDEYVELRKDFLGSGGEGSLTLVASSLSRSATVEIMAGSRPLKVLENVFGTDEYVIRGDLGGPTDPIILRHSGASSEFLPKWVTIYEALMYRPLKKGPEVDIEAVIEGDRVKAKVTNVGTSPVKDLLVVGISSGFLLFREVIPELPPGATREIVKEVSKKDPPLIVRGIYYGVWGQTMKTVRII